MKNNQLPQQYQSHALREAVINYQASPSGFLVKEQYSQKDFSILQYHIHSDNGGAVNMPLSMIASQQCNHTCPEIFVHITYTADG